MKKRDYYMNAIAAKAYRRNAWVLRCFAKTNVKDLSEGPSYDYELLTDNGQLCFVDPETKETIIIEDVPKNRPLFHKREGITVGKGEMPNIKEETYTTYGNVLYNAVALCDAFGDRVDFITGQIDPVAVEKEIALKVLDNPKEGEEKPGEIYVRDLIKHSDNVITLGGYNQIFVPSLTEYTATPAPKAVKRLDELLAEHKDELNDPVVIAKIWKEVAVLDREYLDSDPNKGFVIKSKTVDVVRKRLYYMFGIENDFGGKGGYEFIRKPLDEGIDTKHLPALYNSVREGSFNRGALTALGGEKFKRIIQAMTGCIIAEEDCGTKAGEYVALTKENHRDYTKSYFLENAKLVLATDEELKSRIGQTVLMRSPATCNTVNGNYCVKCMGEMIRGRENALPLLASNVGSKMMSINMAMMHGKALKTVKIDLARVMS